MDIKLLIDEIEELVTPVDNGSPLSGKEQSNVEIIHNAAILVNGEGKIVDYGKRDDVLKRYTLTPSTYVISGKGKTAIPGLVDPHTHLVYKGCRHWELERRLSGESYIDILKKGGGILSTVKNTREATEEDLYSLALKRLSIMLSYGTTSVEIKSGYGLSVDEEEKILRVVNKLRNNVKQKIARTFLGAHAVPVEFRDNPEGYVNLLIEKMLPRFKELADYVDVFLEDGAFNYEQTERILRASLSLGYRIKLHADEITDSKGACLAASLGAESADHLLYASDECLLKMRDSGTIGVLLPSTAYFLRKPFADARKMINLGVPVAIATDHNPGTSPLYSQALNMSFAVFFMGMMPAEALVAATLNAAYAIGLGKEVGSISKGKRADIVLLDAHSYMHLFYETGHNLVSTVILGGEVVYKRN